VAEPVGAAEAAVNPPTCEATGRAASAERAEERATAAVERATAAFLAAEERGGLTEGGEMASLLAAQAALVDKVCRASGAASEAEALEALEAATSAVLAELLAHPPVLPLLEAFKTASPELAAAEAAVGAEAAVVDAPTCAAGGGMG
jgi:hypothetical protein